MKINGINKLEYIYNDCMTKPTFNYKRFGHDMQNIQDMTNSNHWIDNPIYNIDITNETNTLYTDYMNDRTQNASNIYSSVFFDSLILLLLILFAILSFEL